MAEQQKVDIDAETIEKAENMWSGFMRLSKFSTIAIIVVLLLMAFFLV